MGLDLPPKLWLPPKPAIIRKQPMLPASFLPGMFPAGIVALNQVVAPAATATFINTAQDIADLTTYTHSVDLGTNGQYAHIFVGVAARGTAPRSINTLTVAGNSAALRHLDDNGNNFVELWSLAYSAGGTQDIVVTWTNTMVRQGIVVWGVNNLISQTPTDTAQSTSNPSSAAIDCVIRGFILIIGLAAGSSSATAVGTGISEYADFAIDDGANDVTVWGGGGNFATAQSGLVAGCSWAGGSSGEVMCSAAFR